MNGGDNAPSLSSLAAKNFTLEPKPLRKSQIVCLMNIKSNTLDNLHLSLQHNAWATTGGPTRKLSYAFKSVENVILIFSINEFLVESSEYKNLLDSVLLFKITTKKTIVVTSRRPILYLFLM